MRYERKIADKFRYHHYPSISDVLDFDVPIANVERWTDCMADARNGLDWFGDASLHTGNDALKVIGHGWENGLKRAQSELSHITLPRLPSIKRRRVRKDFGDTLDINAVYSGRIDRAWQTTERARKQSFSGGKINLLLNYGVHAGEDSDNIFWRGALAAMLIDAMERTGRRVRFICYNNIVKWGDERGKEPSKTLVLSVTVKEFNHPMALDKLMTAAAFAGFFRTVGFKMILSQPESVNDGLGRKPPDGIDTLPLIDGIDPESTIVIGHGVTSKSDMMREMKRILSMFN